MQIFIGTSGWYYEWNEDLSLDWYIAHSGLNAIELNASFYRFPFPNQVKSWAKKGSNLHWIIKTHSLITHQYKFSENCFKIWEKFYSLFLPLEGYIDYYLFQLPPSLSVKAKDRIAYFINKTGIAKKFALECRNKSWFVDETIKWAKSLEITLVSIDAPEFPHQIFNTAGNIYLRMHGRMDWYTHNYTKKELDEIAKRLSLSNANKVYVFFNNNHNMLENAKKMMLILKNI